MSFERRRIPEQQLQGEEEDACHLRGGGYIQT
jgi:hypothetical protein